MSTAPRTEVINRMHGIGLLHEMMRIRRFEERCAELYSATQICGFLHLYIGEEAVAAGIVQALEADDNVVGTYREHGHALARGVPRAGIMAETFGQAEGVSRGRSGSMQLFDTSRRFYGGNAIGGGGIPLAVGLALADRYAGSEGRVTACVFGEGAMAGGEFHESANLAALWKLRVHGAGVADESDLDALDKEIGAAIDSAVAAAEAGTFEPVEDLGRFVVSERPAAEPVLLVPPIATDPTESDKSTYREAARQGLHARHSHSFEGWYAHIPGLRILTPATLEDVRGMLPSALEEPDPVLIFEAMSLYNREGLLGPGAGAVDISRAALRREGTNVTLVTYGGSLYKTLDAAEQLADGHGIEAAVVDLRVLRPLDMDTVRASVDATHHYFVVDEGWRSGGIAAEIMARVIEECFWELDAPAARVCTAEVPIPYPKHIEAPGGVIQPPQVALVGFGRIREQPWAEHGMLGVRRACGLTLSGDHRANDGHTGGRFLSVIAGLLAHPEAL